jgi:hypothetical protein
VFVVAQECQLMEHEVVNDRWWRYHTRPVEFQVPFGRTIGLTVLQGRPGKEYRRLKRSEMDCNLSIAYDAEVRMNYRWNVTNWLKRFKMPLTLVATGIVLVGCQSALLSYKGARLQQGAVIPVLEGAAHADHFVAPDVVIDYKYTRNGDSLDLSGTAQYAPSIQNNFSTVPRFYLRVYFADAQGGILGYHGIVTSGYGYSDDHMRFHERMALPPGTDLMAFGYSGDARSTGDDDGGGGDTPFWYEPAVR